MRVETPLPADTLLLEHFECDEGVSEQYEIVLGLVSTEQAIDPKKLLRQPITVAVKLSAGGERFFHGIVKRFVQLGRHQDLVAYRAEVVPRTWLLSLATDCRIFQQKSVPDIVKAVLNDVGISEVKLQLSGQYSPREYCVQYRETHLDFISRLMEEEGIFYFFEHKKDKHTIVLADAPSAVKAGPSAKLPMNIGDATMAAEDAILSLEVDNEVMSGKVTLVDYNDTMPKRFESTMSANPTGTGFDKLRRFDYPGKFAAVSEVSTGPLILVARNDLGVKSVRELIDLAKKNPGKLQFGAGGGVGSSLGFGTALLQNLANINITIVPYRGAGPALNDLLGGHIDAMVDAMPVMSQQAKDGKVTPLAVTGTKRSTLLPDVPTMQELGFPTFVITGWYGILAPPGTPQPIVQKLSEEAAKAVKPADVIKTLGTQGMEPRGTKPEEFAKYIAAELAFYSKIVKDANLKPE